MSQPLLTPSEHQQHAARVARVQRRAGTLSTEEQRRLGLARAGYDWLSHRAFVLRHQGARLVRRTIRGRVFLMAGRP